MKKKYLYSLLLLSLSSMMLVSCSKDNDQEPDPEPIITSTGLFILNEGNYYSGINGSLAYLNYTTDGLTDGIFMTANKRSLGGTPNDMVEVDNRLYICCTDENRVEVANSLTGESLGYMTIVQPREVCADESGVYVSSYDGTVYHLNFSGNIIGQSAQIGACLEGITVRDGYVYVCNAYNQDYTYNTNVVKLKTSTLEKVKDITVAANPTQIEYEGGLIYVLSTGNYADVQGQIQAIDADDNVTYLCDATLMAVDENTIYAINAVTDWITYATTTDYFKINGTTGAKSSLINTTSAKEIFSPCGIAYDSWKKILYISSYNVGSTGYADYSGNGYIMSFDSNGTFMKKYDAGVGPTTMVVHQYYVYD